MHLQSFKFEKLFVGRHGESESNLAHALAKMGDESHLQKLKGGRGVDSPLTSKGVAQSVRKGQFLKQHNLVDFDFQLTSTLRRAQQTARHMNLGGEWLSNARLNERIWGPIGPMSAQERSAHRPEWKREKDSNKFTWKPEEGQSLEEKLGEVLPLIEELNSLHAERSGIIVAHGETNQCIQMCIEHLSPEEFNRTEQSLRMDNATLLHYRKDGNRVYKRLLDPHENVITDWVQVR